LSPVACQNYLKYTCEILCHTNWTIFTCTVKFWLTTCLWFKQSQIIVPLLHMLFMSSHLMPMYPRHFKARGNLLYKIQIDIIKINFNGKSALLYMWKYI
jgi:hypothetical protein